MKRGFQEFVVTESPWSLFKTVKVLSFSRIAFSLFISSTLWFFLSCKYGEMHTVFRCSPSNWPWHSFVCSVAPDDSHFPLMLSCWCSMHRVRTLFSFSTCQYISHCLSNLTDILLVDYLVVDWVCSFDRVIVVDFLPT